MNNQQQNPSARFLNIALFLVMGMLAYNLFILPNQQQNADKRTAAEVWKEIEKNALELKDVTVRHDLNVYLSKLRSESQKAKLPQAEINEKEMAALLFAADLELKSGLYRKQFDKQSTDIAFNKLSKAYETIKPKYEEFHTKEIWQKPFPVTPAPRLGMPETERSFAQMYGNLVTVLSQENKTHLVWSIVPGYNVIDFLVKMTGSNPWLSYWFAAFLLALCVRLVIWPLAHKQLMWGRQMSQLQPYTAELKEKFTDKKTGQISDPQAYQAESMKLYKEYGINPLAGCGPALIQLPLFLTVYQCMNLYKFEFTKGFFLWMHPGATSFLGIPLAPNMGERDYIMIALYGITMVTATLLQPVSDPNNAKQSKLMGVGISVFFSIIMFFWPLPSAFVIYWTFTNILSTTQSLITYRLPLPELKKVNSAAGGRYPEDPSGGVFGKSKPTGPSPDFFGKTGTPKTVKPKKKKS